MIDIDMFITIRMVYVLSLFDLPSSSISLELGKIQRRFQATNVFLAKNGDRSPHKFTVKSIFDLRIFSSGRHFGSPTE